ncbi:MAG TPA: right-handed parallel beta-helix repeat-containing protein [Thermoguttaceae bacterium]|nr:right-handed parallel beta-helix repeat-containing protein [Thermoguttaceae bacterium]
MPAPSCTHVRGMKHFLVASLVAALVFGFQSRARAQMCNVKVVTDGNPDYADIGSMIYSITSNRKNTKDKCWALWYWNHIARRQTAPMILHGRELTDPIRQFNDYGYMMCSTVAGANCAIWGAMGLDVKFWDISLHTVPEVEYDGRWHMYDSSLSAIYTLCDGTTIAGVEDIGAEGACAASGGISEPGHIAKYHCLTATSPNGFLAGCDTIRSLADEYRCFNPRGLKYRDYLNNWDLGHRYILNLRENEVYTRYYHRLDADSPDATRPNDKRPDFRADPAYYVPNENKGWDPESVNPRYNIRGNGLREWTPLLTASALTKTAHAVSKVEAIEPAGVEPAQADQAGEIVFKVEGANVITSLAINATMIRQTADDLAAIAVSTTNGLAWDEVWRADKTGRIPVDLRLIEPVNGAYEVLVKVILKGKTNASDAQLRSIAFETVTQLNSKTLPRLRLGKNRVYVGAGEQTESIVLWPDLSRPRYQAYVVEEKNVSQPEQRPYLSSLCAEQGGEEAYVVFRIDAPRDITSVTYGGRFYNRGLQAHVDLLHSFDGGKTWNRSYSLIDTTSPWDVIHHEKVESIPAGTKSVLFKYLWNAFNAGRDVCGLYAVRMEANYRPADARPKPVEVTFSWNELQADYTMIQRSHTQLVESLPCMYEINVGGLDHPVMESLRINLQDTLASGPAPVGYGYSDGKETPDAQKHQDRWVTYGNNLAVGKSYVSTVPSRDNWGSGDPDGKILTDGIVGSPYTGGGAYRYGGLWSKGDMPVVTVDLEQVEKCAAFRIQAGGHPSWDALKGEVKDKVEVLTSLDDKQYVSQGFFDFNLRWKDIPVNDMWPDEETLRGPNFLLIPPKAVEARYVRFAVSPERYFSVSEVQVLDSVTFEPFDLKLALPDDTDRSDISHYNPKHTPSSPHGSGEPKKSEASTSTLPPAPAGNPAEPGVLIEEVSTLKCLGVRWLVGGDGNGNARIAVAYRKIGSETWRPGLDLFRVETAALREPDHRQAGRTMFAGSVFDLEEETAYEVKLSLEDPDGGNAERILRMKTWAEPRLSPDAPTVDVYPGQLADALSKARPGEILRLHRGVYRGTFRPLSGVPGEPIGIVAAGDGEVVLDGQGASNVINAPGLHDVIFEGLTVQNARWGIAVSGGANLVLRRCLLRDVDHGFVATRNAEAQHHILIADNVMIGRSNWPRAEGIEDRRGVQIAGTGHVVCYNRVSRFGDAIDTFSTYPCAAIDFYGNEISECTDDGIEMDYSEHNTRCFDNRLTNVFQGISVQPVHGGPVYVFRNAIYNVGMETFKMHNHPSGAIFYHNTSVKVGMPLLLFANTTVSNCVYRNNLFLGTTANYAYETTAQMHDCDFDFDGFGGQWELFLKWNGTRYATLEDAADDSPAYRHAVRLDPEKAFRSGVKPPDAVQTQFDVELNDLQLSPTSRAIDAGVVLPNVNDGYRGTAPDLGAYELGSSLPHYGPR